MFVLAVVVCSAAEQQLHTLHVAERGKGINVDFMQILHDKEKSIFLKWRNVQILN